MIIACIILSVALVIAIVIIVRMRITENDLLEEIYEIEEKNEVNDELTKMQSKKLKEQIAKANSLQKNINATKCLFCEAPSNGKHFCKECYHKYKDRSIDVRIKNCSNIELLDMYGNKNFLCSDGTRVRSRAEALISNFLFTNKIRYIYEKTVYYNENGHTKELHPDFYLPDYDLYIEYNEINEDHYKRNKEYALNAYKKLNLKVIVMTNDDLFNIPAFLMPKLTTNHTR